MKSFALNGTVRTNRELSREMGNYVRICIPKLVLFSLRSYIYINKFKIFLYIFVCVILRYLYSAYI